MYKYNCQQWLAFFFFYCICGWIWESGYVSAKKKRWVNRGFLHGPMIPIYGFGAIIILLMTLPFQEHLVCVYFAGLLGATALEYVTGLLMEMCFHVKYWDYSNQKFHLNGYICLSSSIVWGIFSVLLIKYVQNPVEKLILRIPSKILIGVVIVFVLVFTIDVVISVKEAFDLKALMAEEKAMMMELKLEVEQRSMMLAAELEQRKEQLETEIEQRKEMLLLKLEKKYKGAKMILKRNPDSTFQKRKIISGEIARFFEKKE